MGRPMLSDLKDSGSIEQDADMVLFINRPAKLGLSEMGEDYDLERHSITHCLTGTYSLQEIIQLSHNLY
jgi:hypothetical protein